MNRHNIIVIVASVVIAGTLGFSASGVVVAENIKFGASDGKDFRYFRVINSEKVAVCNPTILYANIYDINIHMTSNGSPIGQLSLPGGFLEAGSVNVVEGVFTSESYQRIQYLAQRFDTLSQGIILQRASPDSLIITTEVQANILGFIPYHATKSYEALDFVDEINSGGACVVKGQ